jgi:hypothetical protein
MSKTPLYLFVILLLTLVASMVVGYHSPPMSEGVENKTPVIVSVNQFKSVVQVVVDQSLFVLLDVSQDKKDNSFSVLLTTKLVGAEEVTVISYDGKVSTASSKMTSTLSIPPATASSSWIITRNGITIVYSLVPASVCNVFVFDATKKTLIGRASTYFMEGPTTGGVLVRTELPEVLQLPDVVIGTQKLVKSDSPAAIPSEIVITDNLQLMFNDTEIDDPRSIKAWKMGSTTKNVISPNADDFYVVTKDAIVLLVYAASILDRKLFDSFIIHVLDKNVTSILFTAHVTTLTLRKDNGSAGNGSAVNGRGYDKGSAGNGRGYDGYGRGYDGYGGGNAGYGGPERGPFNQGPMVPIFMCSKFNPDGSCAQFSGQNGSSNSSAVAPSSPAPSSPAPSSSSNSSSNSNNSNSSPASNPNSIGGVTNNVVNRSGNLASQVVTDATGLAAGAGLGAGMLAYGAGSGTKNLLENTGSGASNLLKGAGSGAYGLAQGVGGTVDKVITGVGKGIAGVGNELAYLANTAIQPQGQVPGQQAYTAINAVGPAYITGYSNNMAASQIPSVYNYYGAQYQSAPTSFMDMPSSMDSISKGAGSGGGR